MRTKIEMPKDGVNQRFSINIAMVGGGRDCRFFLDLIHDNPSPIFNIKILGVYDKNPDAKGMLLAEQMGIYTTDNLHDLLNIDQLDSVLELTGKRHVLLEIIRLRPKGVGVLEFKDKRIVRSFVHDGEPVAAVNRTEAQCREDVFQLIDPAEHGRHCLYQYGFHHYRCQRRLSQYGEEGEGYGHRRPLL